MCVFLMDPSSNYVFLFLLFQSQNFGTLWTRRQPLWKVNISYILIELSQFLAERERERERERRERDFRSSLCSSHRVEEEFPQPKPVKRAKRKEAMVEEEIAAVQVMKRPRKEKKKKVNILCNSIRDHFFVVTSFIVTKCNYVFVDFTILCSFLFLLTE